MKLTHKNKDVLQSYIMTTAKYDFSAAEKRVLYRIIEVIQAKTKGLKLKYDYSMQVDLFENTEFTLPISCFLKHVSDNNHAEVKKALWDLRNKSFEYEDEKEWGVYGIIEMPKIKKYDSFVKFTVTPLLMGAFLDFSKGYRKYELETAMSFETIYAMRFYELFSNKKEPIIYSIEDLKKMFSIENKYKKRPSDFIARVVEKAKKELIQKAPYAFQYETIKTGRKITHIKFKPFHIPKNRDQELESKELQKDVSLRWEIDKTTINYLKDAFSFDDKGIKNNLDLIKEAFNNENIKDWCADINGMIRKFGINNPAGFFINELKKHLNETKTIQNRKT